MGKNTGCGHYVAHVEKDGHFVIFDDEKVNALSLFRERHASFFFSSLSTRAFCRSRGRRNRRSRSATSTSTRATRRVMGANSQDQNRRTAPSRVCPRVPLQKTHSDSDHPVSRPTHAGPQSREPGERTLTTNDLPHLCPAWSRFREWELELVMCTCNNIYVCICKGDLLEVAFVVKTGGVSKSPCDGLRRRSRYRRRSRTPPRRLRSPRKTRLCR